MKKKTLATLLLVAALIVSGVALYNKESAVGADNHDEGLDTGALSDALSQHLTRRLCRSIFACPRSAEPALLMLFGRYTDEEACSKLGTSLSKSFNSEVISASVEARRGRQRVDAQRAQRCLEQLEAQLTTVDACDLMLMRLPAVCQEMTQGQVADGGWCTSPKDCASPGARCEQVKGQCYGTCEPGPCVGCAAQVEIGGACQRDAACVEGAACIAQDGARRCVAYRAVPRGGACEASHKVCASGLRCERGRCEAVELLRSGERCALSMATGACEPPLVCASVEGDESRCAEPRRAGEPCTHALECEPDLRCATREGLGRGECEPSHLLGQPCEHPADCDSFFCEEGRCAEPSAAAPRCEPPTSR